MVEHIELKTSNKLLRILGVTFGIAIVIGGTIGVGILRNPGDIAAQLGSVWLILFAWILGGIYSLLGANYIAELATMLPQSGGPYVYANRAYGNFGGFIVGWSDWLLNTLAVSYIAIVFGEYAAALFSPGYNGTGMLFSTGILLCLGFLNYLGLRTGSKMQKITSLLKAIALLAFVIICFLFSDQNHLTLPVNKPSEPLSGLALFTAFILAFQRVLATYEGWNAVVYFSEENTNPSRNIPRALFSGIILIMVIYLLVNIGLLYVMPIDDIARSKFAGADAMTVIFGNVSGIIVTILALISLIGILNASMLYVPRILFALSRDGLFVNNAAKVNPAGTPVFALMCTVIASIFFTTIGSFEILLSISTFFVVTNTILLVLSLFILRKREPDLPRPYRTWGYPIAPAIMLFAAIALFISYIVSNFYNSLYALFALLFSSIIYILVQRYKSKNNSTSNKQS